MMGACFQLFILKNLILMFAFRGGIRLALLTISLQFVKIQIIVKSIEPDKNSGSNNKSKGNLVYVSQIFRC